MAEQTDVTFLVEQTGVVFTVQSVGVLFRTVGSNVVALASLADVTVEDYFTVNGYTDVVAVSIDLLGVPSTQLGEGDDLGFDDTVNSTVVLLGFQPTSVDGRVVVQNLDLHTVVSSVNTHGGTDTDTVVYTRINECELETKNEVAVLLFGVEVTQTAVLSSYEDGTVFGYIVSSVRRYFAQRVHR